MARVIPSLPTDLYPLSLVTGEGCWNGDGAVPNPKEDSGGTRRIGVRGRGGVGTT